MRDSQGVELYAYIDISDPMVAWEVAVGRISSGAGKTSQGFGISLWTHRLLRGCGPEGPTKHVQREFQLEQARQATVPDAVSRMDGLYFFESETEALRAADRWGWSKTANRLSRVVFWPTATTIVDSEWITRDLMGDDNDWMPRYWRGDTRGDLPIREVLARGVGLIDNPDLRREAYETMQQQFPFASKLLSCSAAAFWCDCDTAGQVLPGVLVTDDGISSSYAIYMGDFAAGSELDMGAVYLRCQDEGATFPYNPVCDETSDLRLPDFSQYNVRVSSSALRQVALSVHDGLT